MNNKYQIIHTNSYYNVYYQSQPEHAVIQNPSHYQNLRRPPVLGYEAKIHSRSVINGIEQLHYNNPGQSTNPWVH